MFAFWPSFGLLIFFLVIFLECRAIAGRVTLPLGGFMMVFCFGAIGAPLLALLLQQIPILADASASAASPITWLIGPPIEELAKALPVVVLAFLTRESRRLSIADLTLIGFASGAGFGFVEANLNAIANGALPSVEYLAAFGLQTDNGIAYFAGHPVTTALVGLAAGIGLRFLPPHILYAWVPAAFVILWASFDHGIYNWKLLNATDGGGVPTAHFVADFVHGLTLKGQLATWLLPMGLIAAQLIEAYLCSRAVGVRRDLLLAREWRPWVANEWLVALLRARLGRAVFAQTLAYFRLRRAYYLAAFETRRDPKDPTLARHARSLEDRLKRERSILFDPAPGTWLLPAVVLKGYALQWAWRMRWVLLFAVLVLLLFMLDPASLPEGFRQFLFGDVFTMVVVTAGLAFAVWRIIVFGRIPPPDPLAADGTAFASHYTRQLLLGCSLACGLFPSLAMLLGWKALLPGAAFIGGYLPGWLSQGGNLQILLGLGAIGGAVAPDPPPAGEAFRHEIAAGEERIRRLGSEIEGAAPAQFDNFLDAMARLDAERDAQARRQLALDGCERQASEATIRDPAPVVQAIKDEFDRLAGELLEAAAKDLDAMASLEQTYAAGWSEIMQDLDGHDSLRRRLRTPLRQAWQAQNDIRWALRAVESTGEVLLPMQLTLLPELREVAATAISARIEIVAAGVERIRATAAEYGENDPFGFAGTVPAEDDATLLAEFATSTPPAEEPKTFGLRTARPTEAPAAPSNKELDVAKDAQPASTPVPSRGQHYQQALDQLIEATKRDDRYLETIRQLERSDDVAQQPIQAQTPSTDSPATTVDPQDTIEASAPRVEDSRAVASSAEHQDELEDLINAIKRDSGYVGFAKDAPVARFGDPGQEKRADKAADDADKARKHEAPKQETADEHKASLSEAERQEQEKAVFAHRPAPVVSASIEAAAEPQAEVVTASEVIDSEWAFAAAAYKQAQEQAARPSVADAGPATAAAPQAPTEPSQAKAATHAEPAEHVAIETPAAVLEPAKTELATPTEPETAVEVVAPEPAEPAQVEAPTSHAETVERKSVEAPAAPIETTRTDIATPAEPESPPVEAQVAAAPLQAELFERPEIEARSARVETTATEIAALAEPETPVEPAQAEIPTLRGEPVGRVETPVAEEPHQPAPEIRKPDEPTSETESRASFFARLFEAAMRQASESAAKSTGHGTSEDGKIKPEVAQPQTTSAPAAPKYDTESQTTSSEISPPTAEWLADFGAQATEGAKTQADDTLLEKIEWPLRTDKSPDTTDIPVDVAKTPEAPPNVDGFGRAPTMQVVSEPATLAAEPVESIESAVRKGDVAKTRPVERKHDVTADVTEPHLVESLATKSEIAEPAPIERAHVLAEAASAQDATDTMSKPDDEFASKVDRLSHLLDKLERAMQAAAPVLQEPAPPAKRAEASDQSTTEAQAGEPTPAVEPEPAASQPPEEEPAPPKQPDEYPSAPVEEPVAAAEPTTAANAQPDVPQAPAVEHTPAAETAPATTPSQPQAPSEPQPKPDLPQALAGEHTPPVETAPATTPSQPQERSEPQPKSDLPQTLAGEHTPPVETVPATTPSQPQAPSEPKPDLPQAFAGEHTPPADAVPATTPSELEAPSEPQSKPDRLSHLLTKLFEAVNQDSTPKPVKSPQAKSEPATSDIAPPANTEPAHPEASDILDLRVPHPIAEPIDESTSVDPPPANVEERPEPVVPPAQLQSTVLEQPAAPVDAAIAEPARDVPVSEPEPPAFASDVAPPAPDATPTVPEQASEEPIEPRAKRRSSAPATHFGSRKSSRSSPTVGSAGVKPSVVKHSKKFVDETPASTPKRDWKLGNGSPNGVEPLRSKDSEEANRLEPSFRMKTGSGALATVDTAPAVSPAASTNTPPKYYGPRHAFGSDDEEARNAHAQHAISLADALSDYYTRAGTPQPAMYTTDRATLHRIIAAGKLDAPRRRGAPWSISGMSRRGEVAIRLKPGAEQYVEFVPSTEIFGQVPHYYPRGVGKGSYHTHVLAEHLEHFDVTTRQWAPLRG